MKKNTAAGYIRVSTAKQVEEGTSIEDQIEKIEHAAKERGLEISKIYKDEGISGKSDNRPALQSLRQDFKTENFHSVIFTKLDRLARNLRDTLNIYHDADEYDVKMVCLDNPIISTDGKMGNMMLHILGAFAQFERDLIRSRTVAGRMRKWKDGEAFMGRLPFGYTFNKKTSTIEIDEQQKDIVLKIYSLYLDNRLSMQDVAIRLTEDGTPTASQLAERKDATTHWNSTTVRDILKNEVYTGKETFYNQYKYKWNDKNKHYKSKDKKDKKEWITFEFPQIIDQGRFEQMLARVKHNKIVIKKRHKGYGDKFLAENILRCGNCGAKMSKQSTGTKNYIYYVCPWRKASQKQLQIRRKEKCHLPFLNSDKVDAGIFNQIINLITNPKKYAAEWVRNKPVEELTEKESILSQKKQNLKKKLAKAIQIEISTDDLELEKIYKTERKRLELEHQDVKQKLTSCQTELTFNKHKIQKLEEFQKIFALNNRGDGMKVKFALKRALNNLPFADKKKLVDAVISPETGGCVSVRELEAQDIIDPTDIDPNNNTAIPLEPATKKSADKTGTGDFVIELNFTLEPHRIIEIIHAMDLDVIKQGGL